ncbi:MATE efflux family protein [Raphanus sativus]|nr:MATE efflux family protein [Raphanus sativus]
MFSSWMATFVSFVISLAEALALMASRDYVGYIFHPVLSGVAVGCGWQTFVAYVNVGCYYVVGIPIGCVLGFTFNLQAKGIWTGMIGGTLMQTLILLYVTYQTDWDNEVKKARKRLDMWDDKKAPLLN